MIPLLSRSNASLKEDFKIIIKALKFFCKVDKVTIPIILVQSILTAISPYIIIFLSGFLLDALYKQLEIKTIIYYALIGLGLNLVLCLADHRLGKSKWIKFRNLSSYQQHLMTKKILCMDYEYMESEEIQSLIRRQNEYSETSNGAYYTLLTRLDIVLQRFFSIIISIFIVVPLFLKTGSTYTPVERAINSPAFTIVIVGCIAFGVFWSVHSAKHLQRVERASQQNMINLNRRFFYFFNHFLDGYDRGKDVRIFHMQGIIEEENRQMVANVDAHTRKIEHERWQFECINQPIATLNGGFVYLFVGLKALIGVISVGDIVRYAGSITQFITSFSEFMTSLSALRVNTQYLEELNYFLDLQPIKQQGSIPVEKRSDNRFVIECKNVSFRYPGTKEDVIKDLNMTFDIGGKMAIVGRNGSGKTTFIKLLCRLYEPTKGEILLNGIDIRKYDYNEYLKLFSVVFQDSKIYSFSVGNNVAASEEVNKESVIDSLRRAGLTDLLEKLPHGIDTYVYKDFDENGIEISGGEAQRMEIARAIYQNRPFVIMDEPTAALDPVAEYKVYTGFNEMVDNKTAIYISHRLSSCRFCDEILVFDKGRVIQRGSHEVLVKENGLYHKLWSVQAQYYADTENALVYEA